MRILHIEDNKMDSLLIKQVLRGLDTTVDYDHVLNGQEGLDYIKAMNTNLDLILLDINMPLMNGKEFLIERNQDRDMKHIPVVMLTTSENPRDLKECSELNANAYVIKKMDFEQYSADIEATVTFWNEVHKNSSN